MPIKQSELHSYVERLDEAAAGEEALAPEEAASAVRALLQEEAAPPLAGAFLHALQRKGCAPGELAGMLQALDEGTAASRPAAFAGAVDMAAGRGGPSESEPDWAAAAAAAAFCGAASLVRAVSSIAEKKLVSAGLPSAMEPQAAARCLQACGAAWWEPAHLWPQLERLRALQEGVAIPTVLDRLEPLANPAGASARVGWAPGRRAAESMAQAAQAAGTARRLVLLFPEGDGAKALGLAELRSGRLSFKSVERPLGVEEEANGGPAGAAVWAGAALYACGKAASFEEGEAAARRAIASGAAQRSLEAWRRAAQAIAEEAVSRPYVERTGWKGAMPTYPVFLVGMERRRCLVVGGGRLAAEKTSGLLQAGAGSVRVVSPELSDEMAALIDDGRVRHIARRFRSSDLDGAELVYAATDDEAVNQAVFDEARRRGVLVNVVDDPPKCTFIVPSIVRRGGLTLAISTGGASPALAVRLRERLSEEIGEEYGRFVELAAELRPAIMDRIADPAARKRVWYRIVDSPILEWLRAGELEKARDAAERWIAEAADGDESLTAASR